MKPISIFDRISEGNSFPKEIFTELFIFEFITMYSCYGLFWEKFNFILETIGRIKVKQEEATLIMVTMNGNKRFNHNVALNIIDNFPDNEKFKEIFLKNCLRKYSEQSKGYISQAISMVDKNNPDLARWFLPTYLEEGRFVEAKEAKMILKEKFTVKEIKKVFMSMIENQKTEDIKEFFNSDFVTDDFLKIFVKKYNEFFFS